MFKLNSLHLKLLAALFMVFDHIAYFLMAPEHVLYIPLRMLGRIAAPLFWFCLVQGLKLTSNRKKYIGRLGAAALIMGLGNRLIGLLSKPSFDVTVMSPNIFLTMFWMALVIYCIDKVKEKGTGLESGLNAVVLHILAPVCSACVTLFADYGWLALLSILCLYYVESKAWKYGLFIILNLVVCFLESNILQMVMIFAVPLMTIYNPEKPKFSLKWFFYVFYPAHVWLLMLLAKFI